MRDLRDKRVLVTGGARGIGLALALRFAREGAELVLVDKDEPALSPAMDEVRALGAKVIGLAADVTDLNAVRELREKVRRDVGGPDVLVNNAGVVFGGAFLDVPMERHRTTFLVNLLGLVAMTHAFLPDLLAKSEGHLVNVASASGMLGLPFGATYASSKWGVIGFSDSIRQELELQGHHHVKVTAVCPSYVTTGLFDGVKAPILVPFLTPDKVASLTVAAVRRDRLYVRSPLIVKTIPLLKGTMPTRAYEAISRLLRVNTSMLHWRGR